jgi:cytochrome c oxidase subunit II
MKLRRLKYQSALLFLTGLVAASMVSCGGIQNSINPAGPQAQKISSLWWLMFYVCAAVFMAVMISLFVAIAKRTSHSSLQPLLNPLLDGERRRRNAVISAAVLTVVIMFVFLIVSFSVGRSLTAELSNKNALTIEVTGHQWWWEARYLDPSASNIFATANEIHIPVGVPITFSLRSTDVVHSFWVPNLMGKKDLIPGKINTIWLQADKPGVYRGQCAEYCGLQHAHMALWIVAESTDQFNAWRQNAEQTSVSPITDSQKHGQEVFLASACVMCHAINGTPAGSNIGPNLTHIGSRNTIAAGTLPNTREHLAHWIINSQDIKPGNKMPENNLSQADLEPLLDYLQSLK